VGNHAEDALPVDDRMNRQTVQCRTNWRLHCFRSQEGDGLPRSDTTQGLCRHDPFHNTMAQQQCDLWRPMEKHRRVSKAELTVLNAHYAEYSHIGKANMYARMVGL
jgi:hypothetical protein